MPLDPSFAGHAYPRSEVYEVGRAKIREFADAVGDPNPVYREVGAAAAAGYPDVIAPPTFPTILFGRYSLESLVGDERLGLDYDRMVHGDMSFAYTRPVRAGDRVTVVTHIERVMNRAGNDFLDLRVDVDTEDGERVVVARAQLVVRGAV
ncbi:FAS1-like dehydratase domain-containing protein [Actinophytocola sediminis]